MTRGPKEARWPLAARGESHAGGVTRLGVDCATCGCSSNAAPRSPSNRAEGARDPLGDGHLQSSALSFVGGDHPDRHAPHSAPSNRRSPPRLPRDFHHGLLGLRAPSGSLLALTALSHTSPRRVVRNAGSSQEPQRLFVLSPGCGALPLSSARPQKSSTIYRNLRLALPSRLQPPADGFQPGPRTKRPGVAPVCSPSLRTWPPLTKTWITPVENWCGSV